jgi:hypothetical protein
MDGGTQPMKISGGPQGYILTPCRLQAREIAIRYQEPWPFYPVDYIYYQSVAAQSFQSTTRISKYLPLYVSPVI